MSFPGYDHLEPDAQQVDYAVAPTVSIAISLRRIADALTQVDMERPGCSLYEALQLWYGVNGGYE
jgi:hypothetical protein